MRERTSYRAVELKEVHYATLEQWARGKIQAQLQQLLEEEVTTFLGRTKHERRSKVAPVIRLREVETATANHAPSRC